MIQVVVVHRDNFVKQNVPLDCLRNRVGELLEEIQKDMFERAKIKRDSCIVKAEKWDEFMQALNNKKMVLSPWCDEVDVEEDMKSNTKGEMGETNTLCMPFDQPELPEGLILYIKPIWLFMEVTLAVIIILMKYDGKV